MVKLFKWELSVDILIFLVLSFFAWLIPYFPIDLSFTKFIQQINNPFFNSVMVFLSYIGEPFRFTILVVLISLFLFSLKRRQAVFTLISFFGGGVLVEFFKILIHRTRPDPLMVHQYLPEVLPDSFPSGHVMFYVSFFGFLIFLLGSVKMGWVRVIQLVFVLLILLVGISRIYLGEHWLSDVLGSYLLGVVWLYLVVKVYKTNS